jgi:hypothetical protein
VQRDDVLATNLGDRLGSCMLQKHARHDGRQYKSAKEEFHPKPSLDVQRTLWARSTTGGLTSEINQNFRFGSLTRRDYTRLRPVRWSHRRNSRRIEQFSGRHWQKSL